jgi:hypothetical protein
MVVRVTGGGEPGAARIPVVLRWQASMSSTCRPGRRLAGLLIALLVGATALPPALHADMDDLACQFGAARSAGAVQIDANDTGDDSVHCEVCHWVRSIRAFHVAIAGTPVPVAIVEAVFAQSPGHAATAYVPAGSCRAPPLS